MSSQLNDQPEDMEEEEPEPLPSTSSCLMHLADIERYLLQHDVEGRTPDSVDTIRKFLIESRSKACVQKKITDIFKKVS